MKLKNLMLGVASLALVGSTASAATVLHLVGSTAFRPAATAAIIAYIQANGTSTKIAGDDGNCYGGYAGTSGSAGTNTGLYGAGVGYFQDLTGTIVVKTYWTGSAGGLVDLCAGTANVETFLAPTSFTANSSSKIVPGTSYGIQIASSQETDTSAPDASFSDSFASTVATAVSLAPTFLSGHTIAGQSNGKGLAALINGTVTGHSAPVEAGAASNSAGGAGYVGIVPFAWYSGAATVDSGIRNVTQQAAHALLTGPAPVSLFTGSASDISNFVYLIGRNEDSGTRIAALAESQLNNGAAGVGGAIVQFEPAFSAGINSVQSGKITTGPTTLSASLPTGGYGTSISNLDEFQSSPSVTGGAAYTLTGASPLFTQYYVNWGQTGEGNADGHSGFASGGDVANVLLSENTPSSTAGFGGQGDGNGPSNFQSGGNAYLIGYLGWADGFAITSKAGATYAPYGCQQLSYNGVTPNVTNIENGTYTFWCYEHLYYLTGTQANAINAQSPGNQAIADGIADLVYSTWAPTDANGKTATANYPTSGAGIDANEQNLISADAPPAGILPGNNTNGTGTGMQVSKPLEGAPETTYSY